LAALKTKEPSDAELFKEFVEQVHDRAVAELNLDVQPHSIPNTIQWGRFDAPHLFTFDPSRARKHGVSTVVEEAINRIRSDRP